MKIKFLVGDNVMEANDFKNGMRVRDFKKWLSKKVEAGRAQTSNLDNENTDSED
jgi:hypothetical protein